MAAILEVRRNAEAWSSVGIQAVDGDVITLRSQTTAGKYRFEIYDYPHVPTVWGGPPHGAGEWEQDSHGVWFFIGPNPPSFTIDDTFFGRYMLRLTHNDGLDASGRSDPTLVDESVLISVASSSGVENVGYNESNQLDVTNARSLQRIIWQLLNAAGGAGSVTSFEGRTGIVVSATGDYTSDEVTNASTVTGTSVSDALETLDSAIDAVSSSLSGYVPDSTVLTAGAGLTGGGALTGPLTFDVVANADGSIVVNPNDIQVGVLATDAQHGQRGGGDQHAIVTESAAGFMSSELLATVEALEASSVSDHGGLTGLGDDDHTQYLLVDGTRSMGGSLNMGGNSVTNVNLVDGVDVSGHVGDHDNPHETDIGNLGAGTIVELNSILTDGDLYSTTQVDSSIAAVEAHTVSAGAGLTGGGAISGNPTINVATANATIVVNANSIQVGTITNTNVATGADIAVAKLAAGTANRVLTTDGSTNSWSLIDNANVASNAAIVPSKLATGSEGQVLQVSGGTPSWVTRSSGDYTQFVLVDGTRPFTGDVSLGGNDLTNVGTINSVTIEDHSERHRPGNADALPLGTPVAIGASNSAGSSTTFVRSNHVHAHGNQAGGSLHALATTTVPGFIELAGDLAGSGSSPSVRRLYGATVPAGSGLTTGHVLRVTGSAALGYGYLTDANISATADITPSKIAPGSNGQVLATNGGNVVWQNVADAQYPNAYLLDGSRAITARFNVDGQDIGTSGEPAGTVYTTIVGIDWDGSGLPTSGHIRAAGGFDITVLTDNGNISVIETTKGTAGYTGTQHFGPSSAMGGSNNETVVRAYGGSIKLSHDSATIVEVQSSSVVFTPSGGQVEIDGSGGGYIGLGSSPATGCDIGFEGDVTLLTRVSGTDYNFLTYYPSGNGNHYLGTYGSPGTQNHLYIRKDGTIFIGAEGGTRVTITGTETTFGYGDNTVLLGNGGDGAIRVGTDPATWGNIRWTGNLRVVTRWNGTNAPMIEYYPETNGNIFVGGFGGPGDERDLYIRRSGMVYIGAEGDYRVLVTGSSTTFYDNVFIASGVIGIPFSGDVAQSGQFRMGTGADFKMREGSGSDITFIETIRSTGSGTTIFGPSAAVGGSTDNTVLRAYGGNVILQKDGTSRVTISGTDATFAFGNNVIIGNAYLSVDVQGNGELPTTGAIRLGESGDIRTMTKNGAAETYIVRTDTSDGTMIFGPWTSMGGTDNHTQLRATGGNVELTVDGQDQVTISSTNIAMMPGGTTVANFNSTGLNLPSVSSGAPLSAPSDGASLWANTNGDVFAHSEQGSIYQLSPAGGNSGHIRIQDDYHVINHSSTSSITKLFYFPAMAAVITQSQSGSTLYHRFHARLRTVSRSYSTAPAGMRSYTRTIDFVLNCFRPYASSTYYVSMEHDTEYGGESASGLSIQDFTGSGASPRALLTLDIGTYYQDPVSVYMYLEIVGPFASTY